MLRRQFMDELTRGFPEELREVLTDVVAECWARMGEVDERGLRFFHAYADQTISAAVEPGDSKESQLATAFILVFMAGREHALRGYPTPIPKEVIPEEMPPELEDEIEREFGPRHE